MRVRVPALLYIPEAFKSFVFRNKIMRIVSPQSYEDSIPPAQISLQPARESRTLTSTSQSSTRGFVIGLAEPRRLEAHPPLTTHQYPPSAHRSPLTIHHSRLTTHHSRCSLRQSGLHKLARMHLLRHEVLPTKCLPTIACYVQRFMFCIRYNEHYS